MTKEVNELFVTNGQRAIEVSGVRRLRGTASLTTEADKFVQTIIDEIKTNTDLWAEKVQSAKQSHEGTVMLINEIVPDLVQQANIGFLETSDTDELNAMLKSQQSKKSRSASKPMTVENFKDKLNATIAEIFIRQYFQTATIRTVKNSIVDFTEEELQAYANDQELLRRALRNVQSKKSIMKSRVDFEPDSDRWNGLLKAERQLKERRVSGELTSRNDDLKDLIGDVDWENLKAADSKELLGRIASLIK